MSSDWETVHQDDLTAIFLRTGEPPADTAESSSDLASAQK
jgi:hypothetical protein